MSTGIPEPLLPGVPAEVWHVTYIIDTGETGQQVGTRVFDDYQGVTQFALECMATQFVPGVTMYVQRVLKTFAPSWEEIHFRIDYGWHMGSGAEPTEEGTDSLGDTNEAEGAVPGAVQQGADPDLPRLVDDSGDHSTEGEAHAEDP